MIDIDRFQELAGEIMDDLPQELFKELNLGIIVVDTVKYHPASKDKDLIILGQYRISPGMGRSIELYYGSFMMRYAYADETQVKTALRELICHELTHHLESLAGETWLSDDDKIQLEDFLDAKKGRENR